MSIIYKITNTINSKIYIGKSKYNNPNYYGSGLKIKNAIKKYGKTAFVKEILENCSDELVNDKEMYWITFYDSTNDSIGYNISKGGTGGAHYWDTLSPTERILHNKKISEAKKNKKIKPHAYETKQKIAMGIKNFISKNPSFYDQRGKLKCKKYICINHKTNTLIRTSELKEFCKNNYINYTNLIYYSKNRKNFYEKEWSCTIDTFNHLTDDEIIKIIYDEITDNNIKYRSRMSELKKGNYDNNINNM
jgi:hypothetical protein